MDNTKKTLEYYNSQATNFVSGTVNVEFSELQNKFIDYLPEGGSILDFGCGSGRDTKAFKDKGYEVYAVDGSEELCRIATAYSGVEVECSTFQNFTSSRTYDGIWACASLLHLEFEDIKKVMKKLSSYIKEGGCFYVSFKYGDYAGERNGRFFTDLTEDVLKKVVSEIPELRIDQHFITRDARPDREEKWLNAFLLKDNTL